MKILGARINRPVEWITVNVIGTLGPVYMLLGSPLGELPSTVQYVVYSYAGVVLVRLVAAVVLITYKKEVN